MLWKLELHPSEIIIATMEIEYLKDELSKVQNERTEVVTENRELLKKVSETQVLETEVHRLREEVKETKGVVNNLVVEIKINCKGEPLFYLRN